MPIRRPASTHGLRTALLAGVSLAALVWMQTSAKAHPLYGMAGATSVTSQASAAAIANAQQSAQTAQQAMSQLSRATQAVQAMLQQTQATARALAQQTPSGIPNGLATGGLVPDSGLAAQGVANAVTSWTNANAPTQSTSGTQTNVNINQTGQTALLNWQTFNVGQNTTLNFNQQGNSNWVAINRVEDPSQRPSQILGQITAAGQVYVINHNGIVFGGASQINVGTLIASTADIVNTSTIFSAQNGATLAPSFTDAGGAIIVDAGAEIITNTPSSVTSGGGFVLLMGTEVENAGMIVTPQGQTELAAGDNFILRPGFSTNGNSDSTTDGNEIAVELNTLGSSLTGGSGFVENSGYIEADTGDITLAGETVVQNGIALSTTSTSVRGTIHLLSSASDPDSSVTLGPQSVSLILPDANSILASDAQRSTLIANSITADTTRDEDTTIQPGAQFDDLSTLADFQDESRVEIVTGGTVDFQNNSQTIAEGGQISVSATNRVQVDTGALLDVAGDVAILQMSANDLAVNIQGSELADDPNNRVPGTLNNDNIFVDARDLIFVPPGTGGDTTDTNGRYYSAGGVFNVTGEFNDVNHTIQEWMAVGGQITLSTGANGSVVAQQGATFNISGGQIQYQGGDIAQSYLIDAFGNVFNVNNASAEDTYTGVYQGFVDAHPAWGITQIFANPFRPSEIFQSGYTVGRDAGSLILSTPTALFDGTIDAGVITGQDQDTARPASVSDPFTLTQATVPLQGQLDLGDYSALGLINGFNTSVTFDDTGDNSDGNIAVNDAIPTSANNTADFNASQISSFNLGGLAITTQGAIAVNAPLTFAPGANINLTAATIDVAANITAPSGSITISNLLSPAQPAGSDSTVVPTAFVNANGVAQATIESGVNLEAEGLWSNGLAAPSFTTDQAFINGGSVTIDESQGVTLDPGSTIDVSSGAAILVNGSTKGGKGGNVSLIADDAASGTIANAALILGAAIEGFGVSGGGTLTIESGQTITITDQPSDDGALDLAPSLFSTGFSNYDVTSNLGVDVAPGTQVDVATPVYEFTDASIDIAAGGDLAQALQLWLPPLFLPNPATGQLSQRAGASLTLQAGTESTPNSVIDVGAGSTIAVDPGQSINITGPGQITIDGTLRAPGGAASADGGISIVSSLGGQATNAIWIGSNAILDVAGISATALDDEGRSYGVVTNGGSIVLGLAGDVFNATTGIINSTHDFIVVQQGAMLNASGASAAIDPAAGSSVSRLSNAVDTGTITDASNGGSITMSSYSGIYVDGTLQANAGGVGAEGGSLNVTLETPDEGTFNPKQPSFVPRIITISQTLGRQLPSGISSASGVSGLAFGQAQFGANALEAAGFDNLSFTARDAILFNGNVSLSAGGSIEFHEGAIADTSASGNVTISAPYVLLDGQTGINTQFVLSYPTVWGTGTWQGSDQQSTGAFTVNADLIDIADQVAFGIHSSASTNRFGTSTTIDLAGFGNVRLNSQGDIRFLAATNGDGSPSSLATSGDLTLTAAQVYPTTGALAEALAGVASITNPVFSPQSTLTINRVGDIDPEAPDSIGGQLSLAAATVDQNGVVRAPLGSITLGQPLQIGGTAEGTVNVVLGPNSITSASANGLDIPFGGTTDGVTFTVNGVSAAVTAGEITFVSQSVTVEKGAVLDLSGGGTLAGAGFISGEGGSVNVLDTPLSNSNPANNFSSNGNQVFAIVPGFQSGYAPVAPGEGAAPSVGEQITIPAGVPGLPAGTYTLLPANYALLPGGYRVELGGKVSGSSLIAGAAAAGSGNFIVDGSEGIANTGVKSALPIEMILTPGNAVRNDSDFDEEDFSTFDVQQAQTLGQVTPIIPADAGTLSFDYWGQSPGANAGAALTFDGTALFVPAAGGTMGMVTINTISNTANLEIVASTPTSGFTGFSVSAPDLDNIHAPSLLIGGQIIGGSEGPEFAASSNSVTLGSGVDLTAAQVILISESGGIFVDADAEIDTIGQGAVTSNTAPGDFFDANNSAVLVVSNDENINIFNTQSSMGAITVGANAQIFSEGTIDFATAGTVSIDPSARYGTRNLGLDVGTINISSTDPTANAVVPPGLLLTQAILDQILAGDTDVGAPALQRLTLTASQSINFYGSVDLDVIDPATGKADLDLDVNTPAIYGFGSANDVASLTTGSFTWGGLAGGSGGGGSVASSATPTAIVAGGPGTGSGTLEINANEIDFGLASTAIPNNQTTFDLVAGGFSNVVLNAGQKITSTGNNSLSVFQAEGANPGDPNTGGNLILSTPLLTGAAASILNITAGGGIAITAPAGEAPNSQTTGALGGEIDLTANGDLSANAGVAVPNSTTSILVDSTILLQSGKLSMTGTGDIDLQSDANLDLAGQTTVFFDQDSFSWGGTVSLTSSNGNVIQDAGSLINVSAINNNAGSITASAVGGSAIFDGTIDGSATAGFEAGQFSITGQSIGDFVALNTMLDSGGVFGSRSFDIKQGDLTIGQGETVTAQTVSISLDNGSLTVDGTIDASGATPGTIDLAASGNLEIGSSALLDAHGTVLQVDSNGQPVDAENVGTVNLTTTAGTLTLDPGANINVSVTAPNGVLLAALGDIELNAPRTGTAGAASMTGANAPTNATDDNIAVSAPDDVDGDHVNIIGAGTIALNGFATYTNAPDSPDGNSADAAPNTQFITQTYLNEIDQDNQAFINAADNNQTLQDNIAGLTAYGALFHLRPGVEIASATTNGDLDTSGDLDLSAYRYTDPTGYGLQVNSAVAGSGEPGVLVVRAGGNLNIDGSISDGFAPPPGTPDGNGWEIQAGVATAQPITPTLTITLDGRSSGSVALTTQFTITGPTTVSYDLPIRATSIIANAKIPFTVTLSSLFTLKTSWTTTAPIYNSDGAIAFARGTILPAGTVIPSGDMLGGGTVLPGQINIAATSVPAGTQLDIFTSLTLSQNVTVLAGQTIPTGTKLPTSEGATATRSPNTDGSLGQIDAVAPMLPAGDLSWSMKFVGGSDLGAANLNTVNDSSAAAGSGNVVLDDAHFGGTITAQAPSFSVVRTGTGSLDIAAAGDFEEETQFGIYTAGTQSPGIGPNGADPFNLPRGTPPNSTTVLGPNGATPSVNGATYASAIADYQAYFPTDGGNVSVDVGGNMTGDFTPGGAVNGVLAFNDSNDVPNWLWRQGGSGTGEATAWWINFGTYTVQNLSAPPVLTGFTGIGTLGGGNVTINVGGNAGTTATSNNTALTVAIASTGRVTPGGNTLVETGGGNLIFNVGGALDSFTQEGANFNNGDQGGTFTDLRGNIAINAGSIGTIVPDTFSSGTGDPATGDPRLLSPLMTAEAAASEGGIVVVPGDGTVDIETRGTLVLAGVGDAGRIGEPNITSVPGVATDFMTWFSLWTSETAINLFSAGGNLTPNTAAQNPGANDESTDSGRLFLPPTLDLTAASGDMYFDQTATSGSNSGLMPLELAPSPTGQLNILAEGSILSADIDMSGADRSALATWDNPGFAVVTGLEFDITFGASNASPNIYENENFGGAVDTLFTFGPDTPSGDLHANDTQPIRIFAETGDIIGLKFGEILTFNPQVKAVTPSTWFIGAKSAEIQAGDDIISSGLPYTQTTNDFDLNATTTPGFILNDNSTDISILSAGKDILFSSTQIGGPGLLEVTAGGNVFEEDKGAFQSVGPVSNVNASSRSSGAGITILAGIGSAGPDYADFADDFLNPSNPSTLLSSLSDYSQIVQQNDATLASWLEKNFGFGGGDAEAAWTFFQTLPTQQQDIFVRQIYFQELNTSGLEFNDSTSVHFKSYILGQDAAAILFPTKDKQNNPITYSGNITLFGASGIRTLSGGSIETFTPGGETTVGVEGAIPPSTAGLLTQGTGDIDMYSLGDVALGESRILTTFGGNIVIWSAQGNIDAGRGSKTTQVFTPPERLYDNFGDVTLSPQVPSAGAGIGTLNPIPEVPPGDVNLIAPLGTVDAGEAGIRASGNFNVAALHVVDAANIEVQGTVTGIPTVTAPNIGALSSASSASGAAQASVTNPSNARSNDIASIILVDVLGYGGGSSGDQNDQQTEQDRKRSLGSSVQQ